MKLLRWGLAGASAYVIYKYTIGSKAQGEEVFVSPEEDAAGILSPEHGSAAPSRQSQLRTASGRLIGSLKGRRQG